jgi:hypothetical protein
MMSFIERRGVAWLAVLGMASGAGCGDNVAPTKPLDAGPDAPKPDAGPQMCTPPAVAPTNPVLMSGDLAIDAASTVASVALSVPFASTILFTSLREGEPSPQYGNVMCLLQDADAVAMTPTGLVCKRNAAGTDTAASTGVINVHWTVVTFATGVSVQRGTVNTNLVNSNPQVVNLSPTVDLGSSFVLLGGGVDGGTGWGNNELATGTLLDASTLQIANAVQGEEVAYQVVSMAGASVQRGSAAFGMTDTDEQVAVAAVPTGSLALASYTTDNPTSIAAADFMMQTSLINPHTLDFARAAGGSVLAVSWEVASLPYTTISGTADFAVGATTATAGVPGIVAASSVALSSTQGVLGQSTGSTTYAGTDLDIVGETAATLVTGAGTVTLTRASTNATATIPWTVIDFGHDCTGN